ncbi:MAG: hypothetical protein QXU47_06775 [Candidatus Bathyarchaeia archaeon]
MLLRAYLHLESLDSETIFENDRLYHRYYMKLRRFIASLEKKGLVEVSKIDGLLWVKPKVDLR